MHRQSFHRFATWYRSCYRGPGFYEGVLNDVSLCSAYLSLHKPKLIFIMSSWWVRVFALCHCRFDNDWKKYSCFIYSPFHYNLSIFLSFPTVFMSLSWCLSLCSLGPVLLLDWMLHFCTSFYPHTRFLPVHPPLHQNTPIDELYSQKLKYKAISEELDHALNDMTSM